MWEGVCAIAVVTRTCAFACQLILICLPSYALPNEFDSFRLERQQRGIMQEGCQGTGKCGATTNFKDLNVVPNKSNRIESHRTEAKAAATKINKQLERERESRHSRARVAATHTHATLTHRQTETQSHAQLYPHSHPHPLGTFCVVHKLNCAHYQRLKVFSDACGRSPVSISLSPSPPLSPHLLSRTGPWP